MELAVVASALMLALLVWLWRAAWRARRARQAVSDDEGFPVASDGSVIDDVAAVLASHRSAGPGAADAEAESPGASSSASDSGSGSGSDGGGDSGGGSD